MLLWFESRAHVSFVIYKQDGRLAPSLFSPNYKYFDQLLQTVKKETTVLNLVFKSFFTHVNSTTDLCRRVSRFSVKNFLSHSAGKPRRGTLLCFTKFLVSKKVVDKRGGGGREYHDFMSKIFCLTVPKIFIGESFGVSLISGFEKS